MLYFPASLPENADRDIYIYINVFFFKFLKNTHWLNEKTKSRNHDMTHESSQKQNRTLKMGEALLNMHHKKKGTLAYKQFV